MFWHQMQWKTEGISVVAPVQWRALNGMVAAYWQAESAAGASGYYVAEDPRIMVFMNDVHERISLSNTAVHEDDRMRGMMRAVYVPAGVPIRTKSVVAHRFSHLNLHIHKDRLMGFLTPALGQSQAQALLARPVEVDDPEVADGLARLVIGQLGGPVTNSIYLEALVGSVFSGVMAHGLRDAPRETSYLTPAQINRIAERFMAQNCRMSVAEMADVVGLSESWFSHVFKKETGSSPLQWQVAKRVAIAKDLLARTDLPLLTVAYHCGFADQAHFTKVFGKQTGETPAGWRRRML